MYRMYEDPYALETELKSLKEYYNQLLMVAEQKGCFAVEWDIASDVCQEIAELEAELEMARSKAALIRQEWDLLDEDIEFEEEKGE